jgi:hypothetical protein
VNRRQLLRSAAALPLAGAAFSAAWIAAIADSYGLELASHGGSATNLNMLLAMPNAIYMESGGARKLVNGEMLAPEEPGMSSEPKG